MNFYTLFLKTENVHLLKDVGMIPESLAKYCGTESYIVTYNNDTYTYLGNEVSHLKLLFLKKKYGKILDGVLFIVTNRMQIDVLNIYHLNLASFIWAVCFNIVKKHGSKLYLKLDADYREIEKLKSCDLGRIIKRITIKLCDVVSVESTKFQKLIRKMVNREIVYLPNGYYEQDVTVCNKSDKENIIMTVGRLGTYQKATEILVQSYLNTMYKHDWKLVLIGPLTAEFKAKMEKIFVEKPEIKERISVMGEISDRKRLEQEYRKAKIFALPSRWEGCPLVLVEALRWGTCIITTNQVPNAEDIIYKSNVGRIINADDILALEEAMLDVISNEPDWEELCGEESKYARDRFLWENLVKKLYQVLMN